MKKSDMGILPPPAVGRELTRTLTGIRGLDEITRGALTDRGLTVLDAAAGPRQGGDRYAAV